MNPCGQLDLIYKPDAVQAMARMEAYWNRAILDRPAIQICTNAPDPRPWPSKKHATLRDRWMDVDYALECAEAQAANTLWIGEILPTFFPNLGPEILTAAYGADLEFGEDTSWSKPILTNWDQIPELKIDPENIYVKTILEMTRRAAIEGKGKYLTGITDIHPGADLAASLREPQQFCIDLADSPDQVALLNKQLFQSFFEFYELQRGPILAAGQTITTSWLPLYTDGRFYIPSCDFSCMISTRQFKKYFLPEIIAEIEWLDHSIYHLDGPNALRHLDALLEIDKLDGIQYVCGAALEPTTRWLDIYRKIQLAGKCIHVGAPAEDIDWFMEALDPEGVLLYTWVSSKDEADALLKKVSAWTRKMG